MKTKKPYFKIESNNPISARMMNCLDITKPVKVYYNLHKKCLSVQQSGLVKFHTEYIVLRDVTFKVSEAGRQRVLKEKRKNVHAFIHGYISCPRVIDDLKYEFQGNAKYNPYKYSTFVDDEGEPVESADFVDVMTGRAMSELTGCLETKGASINIHSR